MANQDKHRYWRSFSRRVLGPVTACSTLLALSIAAAQPKAEIKQPNLIDPVEGKRLGEELVADLLSRPPEISTRTNVLRNRLRDRTEKSVPVLFDVRTVPGGWVSTFQTLASANAGATKLVIQSRQGMPNTYVTVDGAGAERRLSGNETMFPFAGSEFWVADLGLEFLHWPKQVLLKKELRKGQACDVLESTNPSPGSGGYSRVVSWIDIDTGGIVHADAYDHQGRILKQFDPSELQKVDGRMQVKEIEMRNRQTGSRSWVEFQLK